MTDKKPTEELLTVQEVQAQISQNLYDLSEQIQTPEIQQGAFQILQGQMTILDFYDNVIAKYVGIKDPAVNKFLSAYFVEVPIRNISDQQLSNLALDIARRKEIPNLHEVLQSYAGNLPHEFKQFVGNLFHNIMDGTHAIPEFKNVPDIMTLALFCRDKLKEVTDSSYFDSIAAQQREVDPVIKVMSEEVGYPFIVQGFIHMTKDGYIGATGPIMQA